MRMGNPSLGARCIRDHLASLRGLQGKWTPPAKIPPEFTMNAKCSICDIYEESGAVGCPICGGVFDVTPAAISESELLAFIETIPESILPHLTEKDIEEEYRHHFGKP